MVVLQTGKASLVEELRSMSVVKSRLEVQLAAAIAGRTKDTQDIARLRAERNNAVSEYNLVMSERDSVLRESERLRSTISDLELKVEAAERNRKAAIEEAERARVEFEAGRLQAEALASSLSMDSSYLTEIDHLRRDLDKMQAELLGNELLTLANVDRFSKFFHQVIRKTFSVYISQRFPPHLQYVGTLPQ